MPLGLLKGLGQIGQGIGRAFVNVADFVTPDRLVGDFNGSTTGRPGTPGAIERFARTFTPPKADGGAVSRFDPQGAPIFRDSHTPSRIAPPSEDGLSRFAPGSRQAREFKIQQRDARNEQASARSAAAEDAALFGGVKIGNQFRGAVASVFGGSDDPVDNGLSAFGGKTGPGAQEGVALPKKVLEAVVGSDRSLWPQTKVRIRRDGKVHEFPVVDLGTAEWVWERAKAPVLDLTEGAAEALGGSVRRNKAGKITGLEGLGNVDFEIVPPTGASASGDQQLPGASARDGERSGLFPKLETLDGLES